ncbi:MAG: hypothetical protein O2909_06465 [Chloroflexi bacterium]|nr:hypothetical protein [Chloroflexota bacterium]MDA1219069.1 hypothetical protein [Chloroflexota bacterium]
MARSLRDAVELEARGVPTVVIHTEAFRSAAMAHAQSLGQSDFGGSVFVQHPIATLDRQSVHHRVDEAMPAILAALLERK